MCIKQEFIFKSGEPELSQLAFASNFWILAFWLQLLLVILIFGSNSCRWPDSWLLGTERLSNSFQLLTN